MARYINEYGSKLKSLLSKKQTILTSIEATTSFEDKRTDKPKPPEALEKKIKYYENTIQQRMDKKDKKCYELEKEIYAIEDALDKAIQALKDKANARIDKLQQKINNEKDDTKDEWLQEANKTLEALVTNTSLEEQFHNNKILNKKECELKQIDKDILHVEKELTRWRKIANDAELDLVLLSKSNQDMKQEMKLIYKSEEEDVLKKRLEYEKELEKNFYDTEEGKRILEERKQEQEDRKRLDLEHLRTRAYHATCRRIDETGNPNWTYKIVGDSYEIIPKIKKEKVSVERVRVPSDPPTPVSEPESESAPKRVFKKKVSVAFPTKVELPGTRNLLGEMPIPTQEEIHQKELECDELRARCISEENILVSF